MLPLLIACMGSEPTTKPAAPVIVATSFSACDLARRLTNGLEIRCIQPPGEDPQTWQPDGPTISALADADLILSNGAGFEAWMKTAALPASRVVDLSEGIDLITLEATTHSHGIGGDHSHEGIDPHTWLDPLNHVQQARNAAAALGDLADPASLSDLETQLTALHEGYAAALSGAEGISANHPAYHYLARRHGLTIPSLDLDPHSPPPLPLSPGGILLWEQTPEAAVTAMISARHVVLDPLEQPPDDGTYDYLAQSASNVALLSELLAAAPDGDHSHE